MKRARYYFEVNTECGDCFTLKYFKRLRRAQKDDLILEQAEIETGSDYFYCSKLRELCTKEDSGCGSLCKDYEPCNGKSGRCKHNKNCYTGNGIFFRLTKDLKLVTKD